MSRAQMHLLADVLEAGVAHQRAGQQAGLGEDLKAVADAEHKATGVGEVFDGLHDGREAGDGAGAEIVAIGEAAGHEHRVDSLQIVGVVPEKGNGLTRDVGDHVLRVVIAVGTGKNQNPEFHGSRVTVSCGEAMWNDSDSSVSIDLKKGERFATVREDLLRFDGAQERDPAVDAWLRERAGALGAMAREWFEVMRGCGDEVRELVHDGCPVACLGDAPFGYVNVFSAHVNVGFFHGNALADPARLLQGTGKRMRHVKLRPGTETNAAALRNLIEAGVSGYQGACRERLVCRDRQDARGNEFADVLFADGPAGDEQTGARRWVGSAEIGERGVEDLLIGLGGVGDDGAGEVGREPFGQPLGGEQCEVAAGHVDDAGGVFKLRQRGVVVRLARDGR